MGHIAYYCSQPVFLFLHCSSVAWNTLLLYKPTASFPSRPYENKHPINIFAFHTSPPWFLSSHPFYCVYTSLYLLFGAWELGLRRKMSVWITWLQIWIWRTHQDVWTQTSHPMSLEPFSTNLQCKNNHTYLRELLEVLNRIIYIKFKLNIFKINCSWIPIVFRRLLQTVSTWGSNFVF